MVPNFFTEELLSVNSPAILMSVAKRSNSIIFSSMQQVLSLELSLQSIPLFSAPGSRLATDSPGKTNIYQTSVQYFVVMQFFVMVNNIFQ